jgi:hypothetical protein
MAAADEFPIQKEEVASLQRKSQILVACIENTSARAEADHELLRHRNSL